MMDGLEVARHVKANPEHAAMRMVMLTSVAQCQVAATAKEIGIAACLTRPVRALQLQETLAVTLGEGRDARGLVPAFPEHAVVKDNSVRVLVVEDNPVNQKVAVKFLEKLGFNADVAAHGLEATRVLRQSEETGSKRPHIVALTAGALADERQKCLDAGMDEFLAKPVRLEALRELIVRVLADAAAQRRAG